MKMQSEFERVEREGGDASNLSVAVTRAFGDVDERCGSCACVHACLLGFNACNCICIGLFGYMCRSFVHCSGKKERGLSAVPSGLCPHIGPL